MGKVTGIIALCISVICLLACTINVFISIDTYGKNKTRITTKNMQKHIIGAFHFWFDILLFILSPYQL